jgi:hypothetical protein
MTMKVYLKLFLAAMIPYALAFSVMTRNTGMAIGVGVVLGLIIAGIFGTLQIRSMKGKKKADETYAVNQEREMEIDLPFDRALELTRTAVLSISGATIMKEYSPEEGAVVIGARTGLNWETYGEKIGLYLERIDADTTLLRVESRPRLRTTLIDYGRNLHNVNAISLYVREHTASDHLQTVTQDEIDRLIENSEERLAEPEASRG